MDKNSYPCMFWLCLDIPFVHLLYKMLTFNEKTELRLFFFQIMTSKSRESHYDVNKNKMKLDLAIPGEILWEN